MRLLEGGVELFLGLDLVVLLDVVEHPRELLVAHGVAERLAPLHHQEFVHRFDKLDPGQFTVKGYGKSKPIVPNTNALNWAKNRRVEFVVTNKDVLKKEIEKRRLLQKAEPAPADTTKK